MNMLFDLTGKIAVVTGGSRGLGKTMALALAKAGAKVVVADILDVSETAGAIEKQGGNTLGVKVDVTKKEQVEKMVQQAIKKFSRIDILVNNAGIFRTAPTEFFKEDDWDDVMAVNLKGSFLCAQGVGKQMIKQGSGVIINISSIAGQFAFCHPASFNSSAYSASKAGVILLTKTLAAEWGKYNIRVNAICPGTFRTIMNKDILENKRYMHMMKTRVPLARIGEPEELVGTVIFLASKASGYVTGQVIFVDGGWSAGL